MDIPDAFFSLPKSLEGKGSHQQVLHFVTMNNFGMRPGIILLREGTDTSQVRQRCAEAASLGLRIVALRVSTQE